MLFKTNVPCHGRCGTLQIHHCSVPSITRVGRNTSNKQSNKQKKSEMICKIVSWGVTCTCDKRNIVEKEIDLFVPRSKSISCIPNNSMFQSSNLCWKFYFSTINAIEGLCRTRIVSKIQDSPNTTRFEYLHDNEKSYGISSLVRVKKQRERHSSVHTVSFGFLRKYSGGGCFMDQSYPSPMALFLHLFYGSCANGFTEQLHVLSYHSH